MQVHAEPESVESTDWFSTLSLSPTTHTALARAGFHAPTPIQANLIPPALEGRDCLGNAPTGTGKTAAFLIPLIERLDERNRRPQAVVLAPTRELVHQIGREFARLTLGRRLWAVPVVGGESIDRQQRQLRQGCQLILATPGRLIDLLERGSIRLDAVRHMVLDEADQMLDIGFRPAIDRILESTPTERQTLLLSATMPRSVRDLARTYLNDPVDVRLIREKVEATIPNIRQSILMVYPERKLDLLVEVLRQERPERTVVFCRTKHGSDRIGQQLLSSGFRAAAMHGDLSQSQRNRVLDSFRKGRISVLVATDVVGRGIDVPQITHVVNFDVPEDPQQYIHRIGRTGRMGNDGAALTFLMPDQVKLIAQIERAIGRSLEESSVESIPGPPRPVEARPGRRDASMRRRGFQGNRSGRPAPRPRRFGGRQDRRVSVGD